MTFINSCNSHELKIPEKGFGISKNHLTSILVMIVLLTISSVSFAVTLPFTDDFTGANDAAPGSDWNWYDCDDRSGTTGELYNNQLEIKAYGRDVWTDSDEYAGYYLNDVNGNFTAVVQVTYQNRASSWESLHSWAKSGIMVRNDFTDENNSTGYVILAVTPGSDHKFSMQADKNNNGRLDRSTSVSSNNNPPDTWLKLEKDGTTFKGYYSYDGVNWTLIKTYTVSSANAVQDVGLFSTSHKEYQAVRARFDNFGISGSGATYYTYYRDFDQDGYGNQFDTTVSSSTTAPVGYIANTSGAGWDCDDSDATKYPGNIEICDGKDNDCDGNIDEDVGTNTYYYDADGDGYGVNDNTQPGCVMPSGYAAYGGDCNDADASIHPGTYDICGDSIDQDCNGSDRACGSDQVCLDIADVPLATQINAAPPLVMFLLDDSGSMAWDVLCPENNGRFDGENWVSDRRSAWKNQYSGYNGIYYNPASTYEPWETYSNADPNSPKKHPLGSDTRNLSSEFKSLDSVSIKYAHWYVWSATESAPYLVNLDGSAKYYKVTRKGSGDHGEVRDLELKTSPPNDVKITRTYAQEKQNFANWYKYYRTRELVAKAALGKVIADIKQIKVGIHTINKSVKQEVLDIKVAGAATDHTNTILNKLYSVAASGGTPLRRGLEDVGQYYHASDDNNGNIGASPYATDSDGGSCQQAFAIVMTDGYYNGDAPNVGNADGDNSSTFDGSPYGDTESNTLADVAMYYYENDLNPSLADTVPQNDVDKNSKQHMVTYTVSFGLTGTLSPVDTCPSVSCPTWPSPGDGDDQKIDDLWHTAVNGRGKYLSASDTDELVNALSTLMTDIQDRTRTAAPVSLNTQKIENNTDLYQGFFDSADWSGDLQAFDVSATGGVASTKSWSAAEKLQNIPWSDRKIITFNGTTGKPFRYDDLTAGQQAMLDPDPATAQKILEYIRGSDQYEVASGGTFRDRSSKLGDIVGSSPTFFKDMVYIGANDGMLHGFNASDGTEQFAFIPSMVIEKLKNLTDVNYSHNYFVDNTVYAGTIESPNSTLSNWIVGGLGKGGRGYYGINVTGPNAITESNIPAIWEYPLGTDDDMGFSYSDVSIIPANHGDYIILFGNGYDSVNGKAFLYALKPDGTLLRKIPTEAGDNTTNCNGLSSPTPIDSNYDGKVDYVYAGDLLGNLWKFDLTSTTPANWGVSYKDANNTPQPLFQARDSDGNRQPITGRVAVMGHCNRSNPGFMIVFGTGKYLSHTDTASVMEQSIYGIWDWGPAWIAEGETDSDKPLGYFMGYSGIAPNKIRKLSNLDGNSNIASGLDFSLLEQTQVADSAGFRTTTNHDINYFSPRLYKIKTNKGETYTNDDGRHIGWFYNLPKQRERVIARAQIRDGKAIVVSIFPSDLPCSEGGGSVVHVMSACNGGQLDEAQFDVDGDNDVDGNDASKAGKIFDNDIYYAPAIIEDQMYFSRTVIEKTTDEARGLHYWRMIDR